MAQVKSTPRQAPAHQVAGTLFAAGVLISSLLAATPPTAPATTADPTPSRPGKVYLSGENPWVFLYDAPQGVDGPAATMVSFWRIHWSPVGKGHVCFVTTGAPGSPGARRFAMYDNEALYRYLVEQVLGTYNKAYQERPFEPVAGARFASSGDGTAEWKERCEAPGHSVELHWRGLETPALVDILPRSRTTNPFGITYLRIRAASAEVRIDGAPAPGVSAPGDSFLAFGETWTQ
jgi:hypothetical protein